MGNIIVPNDFARRRQPVDRWQAGYIRHVIAALKQRRVAVVSDSTTGVVQHPVVLLSLGHLPRGGGYGVLVREFWFADGVEGSKDVWFPMANMGAIIDLEQFARAKWDALRSYQDESSQAVKIAQDQHGAAEGRGWGAWSAEPEFNEGCVYVTYTPHTGNPAYADRWGTPWSGTIQV